MDDVKILLITIVVLSTILNGLVIAALIKRWDKLGSQDVLLFFNAVCNFLQSLIGYTGEAASESRNNTICVISAFSISAMSYISIMLLASISIARMLSLCYPLRTHVWLKLKSSSLYFIVPSITYALLWAMLPLFGWSKYGPELASKHRCSINFNDQETNTITYLYSLLIACFLIPVSIMVICFIKIKKGLNRKRAMMKTINNTELKVSQKSLEHEMRLTVLVIVMISAFLICWTPYAILVFVVSFGHGDLAWLDTCAMMGKASVIFNPIIYAIIYKEFRLYIAALFGIRPSKIWILSDGSTRMEGRSNTTRKQNVLETAKKSTDTD